MDNFFKESPLYPSVILSTYYLFIFLIGPKLMQNRNAFALKNIMLVYNMAQMILNAYILLLALKLVPFFNITCVPPNESDSPEDTQVRDVHYYYLLLKYFDLLDTIFFVLRKKTSQVTFLHVYHHTMIIIITWISFKYAPGGPHFYLTIYNTITHVIMYGYYLLSAWDSQKFFWCRKYITQSQMIQHACVFGTFTLQLLNPYCPNPKMWILFCDLNGLFTTYLFVKFYSKNYKGKKT